MGMWASIGAAIGAVAGLVISIYAPELGVPLTAVCTSALTAAGSAGDAKVEKNAAEAKKEGDDRAAELQASRERLTGSAPSFGRSAVVNDASGTGTSEGAGGGDKKKAA